MGGLSGHPSHITPQGDVCLAVLFHLCIDLRMGTPACSLGTPACSFEGGLINGCVMRHRAVGKGREAWWWWEQKLTGGLDVPCKTPRKACLQQAGGFEAASQDRFRGAEALQAPLQPFAPSLASAHPREPGWVVDFGRGEGLSLVPGQGVPGHAPPAVKGGVGRLIGASFPACDHHDWLWRD